MSHRTRYAMVSLIALAALGQAAAGLCNELRILTLGNPRIALEDEDTRLNPYDYGRNAAYLLRDFERGWKRFDLGLFDESGMLKRSYDPEGINDVTFGASGFKRLGDRHAIRGSIDFGRRVHENVPRSLEIDQYNDPFYMTDETTGTFEYYGPSTKVDYSLRLWRGLYVGAGLDYDLSTGLKDTYTRPEIIHDHFRGNLGVIVEPFDSWAIGVLARPVRTQNRTEFDKTVEGYDNLIYRYYGDGIYDILSTGGYTVRENLDGYELGVQNFIMTDRLKLSAQGTYLVTENDVQYGTSSPHHQGLWERTVYDVEVRARYVPWLFPATVGVCLRRMSDDSWGLRPEFDDVVLVENPVSLNSAGVGANWEIQSLRLLTSVEYVANDYDVEVWDHGARTKHKMDVVQQVGRLGVEHLLFGLHSIRAGIEYTDFLVDRWLKLPPNTDRYRATIGFQYRTGYWDFDMMLGYGRDTKQNFDADRETWTGVIWMTGLLN
jgi:hypothetical protein